MCSVDRHPDREFERESEGGMQDERRRVFVGPTSVGGEQMN